MSCFSMSEVGSCTLFTLFIITCHRHPLEIVENSNYAKFRVLGPKPPKWENLTPVTKSLKNFRFFFI